MYTIFLYFIRFDYMDRTFFFRSFLYSRSRLFVAAVASVCMRHAFYWAFYVQGSKIIGISFQRERREQSEKKI